MPPARNPSPPLPPPPSSDALSLPSFDYLSSPVPDLASTLYSSQEAEEADRDNVRFLRSSLEELSASASARRVQGNLEQDPGRFSETTPGTAETASQTRSIYPEDISRRERLHRVLSRLNRLHEPAASTTTTAAAYTNRTPSPNRQSLYDWAPSAQERGHEQSEIEAIFSVLSRHPPDTHPGLLRVLGESQVNGVAMQREGEVTVAAGTSVAEAAERRDRLRERDRRRRESEWVSLRARAAIQRSRQEGSPSSTDRMLRYVMERERSGMSEEEERARTGGWFRPNPSGGSIAHDPGTAWTLPHPSNTVQEQQRQERLESYRRGYLAENVPPRIPRLATPAVPAPALAAPSNPSLPFVENALKYLNDLRTCSSYEEALSAAIDHRLATKEFLADKHDDFIMDLHSLDPLPYSSWLQPGTVFSGHQHAMNGCVVHSSRSGTTVEQINPNFSTSSSARSSSFDATRPWQSHRFTPPNIHPSATVKRPADVQHDQWPVRVIIHSVDPERMTIQGTMEAYDVPQHPRNLTLFNSTSPDRPKAGRKHAPIITYLEGHIIDLTTHSFLTPNSAATSKPTTTTASSSSSSSRRSGSGNSSGAALDARTSTVPFPTTTPILDAQNWLKLPPFSTFISSSTTGTNEQDMATAQHLLSSSKLSALLESYIFMRWKEKCFVHSPHEEYTCSAGERSGDQDRGHGLTISGFYYVSLRREDGWVEGLYFDPGSTPFQVLRLQGCSGRGWGSWEFT